MSRTVPAPQRSTTARWQQGTRSLVAGNATFALGDAVIPFDTAAGNRTAQLPAASSVPPGTTFEAINVTGANNVDLTPNGADTIDGGGAFVITPTIHCCAVQSDGVSAWTKTIGGF